MEETDKIIENQKSGVAIRRTEIAAEAVGGDQYGIDMDVASAAAW